MAQGEHSESSADAAGSKRQLPPGWIVRQSKSYPDRVYYFNTVTGASTWQLPELVQSLGSSVKEKKKHRHHKKHSRNKHRLLGQKPETQQLTTDDNPDDDDDDDDDVLDLTCDSGEEPGPVFPALAVKSSEIKQKSVSAPDTADKEATANGLKGKKKWKRLWDSPLTLKTDASTQKEECSLTKEELQIIRFPKGSHAKGTGGEAFELTDNPFLSQGVNRSPSGHGSSPKTCADSEMGNRLLGFGRGSHPTSASPERTDQACAQSHRQCVRTVSSPSLSASLADPPGASVVVEYKLGLKRGSKQTSASWPPGEEPGEGAGEGQKKQASPKAVVEVRHGVRSSAAKDAASRPGRTTGQPRLPSQANTRFTPRVLTTARPDKAPPLSHVTGSTRSNAVNDRGVPQDVRVGTTQRVCAAHTTEEKRTDSAAETTAKKPRITGKCNSPPTSETSGGSGGLSSQTACRRKSPVSGTSRVNTAADCEQENTAIPSKPEASAAQDGSSQGERTILKAKRKRKRPKSPRSSEECGGNAPHTPTASSTTSGSEVVDADPGSSLSSVAQARPRRHAPSPPGTQGWSRPGHHARPTTCVSGELCAVSSSSPLASSRSQTPERRGSFTPVQSVTRRKVTGGRDAFPITPDLASVFRDGEAEMEVDDDVYIGDCDSDHDQVMMDLQELRENFQPDMKAKALGVLTESVQETQATRPVTPVSDLSATDRVIHIVVDTNVLVGELKFVQDLRDVTLRDYGRPYLIIPWVVLQELDGLKMSKCQSKKAQDAVRYIHSCLVSHHPRVRGQTPAEAQEPVATLEIQCNDDRILQCCLQCQRKYGQNSVLLLTNDLNLENKAVVMAITSFSSNRLEPLMSEEPAENSCSATAEVALPGSVQSGRRSSEQNSPRQTKGDTGRSTPVSITGHSREVRRAAQATQRRISSVSDQQPRQQKKLVDELLCEGKAALKSAMCYMVEREMKEAYGDLWLDVVYRKPPWSPHDLVLILQKHWIAVFQLKFERPAQSIVDDLVKELRPGHGVSLNLRNVQVCLQNCLLLAVETNKFSPCPASVRELERLVQKGTALQQESARTTTPPPPPGPSPQSASGQGHTRRASSEPRCSKKAVKRPAPTTASASTSSPSPPSPPAPTTPVASLSSSASHAGQAARTGKRQGAQRVRAVADTKPQTAQRRSPGSVGQRRSPPKSSNVRPQIPQTNTAEENAAIGEVFQGIWSVIYNCCDNVEKMIGPSCENGKLHEVKDTLVRLLPHVVQLYEAFKKCLAFSPYVLDQQVESFSELCDCLNSFFDRAKIPASPLPVVLSPNMIVFMRNTENRVPLRNGVEQLNDLIGRLQKLISLMPSIS